MLSESIETPDKAPENIIRVRRPVNSMTVLAAAMPAT